MDRRREALFSDGTREFLCPTEPRSGEKVRISLRALKNTVQEAALWIENNRIVLSVDREDGEFCFLSASYQLAGETVSYFFEVNFDGDHCCYDKRGVVSEPSQEFFFILTPDFKVPDWAKGAVMYQIFTDRFCNGNGTNGVKTGEYFYIDGPVQAIRDWNQPVAIKDVGNFYGGDLQGVWNKLDYLQSLGIEVIYFNPLFVSPSNHKYDSQDYDNIDPHFGLIMRDEGECLPEGNSDNLNATKYICRVSRRENLDTSNAFFATLVQEIHRRGMKVILDGVFNHCGSFHKWMDRERIYEHAPGYAPGAYVAANSPYRRFFEFTEDCWPYNEQYSGWWNHKTLPKLNYEASEELCEYILNVARKWVSPPYNVDGWRLDVAADLGHSEEFNHSFWKRFRAAVKEANPNALILAEHYGCAKPWLNGKEWDSVMNYDGFMEPLTYFLTGMEKHSDFFRGDLVGNAEAFSSSMRVAMAQFQTGSLQTAMNELSNHDHSRFLTRTNGKVGRLSTLGADAASEDLRLSIFMAAVTMQMTWVGAPTVYYGDEAGLCGFTDPDNRRTYPWGREDKTLIRLHKELIRIHRSYQPLKTGSLKIIYEHDFIISYGRFDERDVILVAVNQSEQERFVELPVWQLSIPEGAPLVSLMRTDRTGFSDEAVFQKTNGGIFLLQMPPESSFIWKGSRYVKS